MFTAEQNAYMALGAASRAYAMESGRIPIPLESPVPDVLPGERLRRPYLGG